MAGLSDNITRFLSDMEDRFDALKLGLVKRLGLHDPVQICAYRSFGSQKVVHVWGRVLEHKRLRRAEEDDSTWENILQMYRRFGSDEVPGARLRIRFNEETYETVTDKEGYFSLDITPKRRLPDERWQQARIDVVDAPFPTDGVEAEAQILVPRDAEYGVISDIDDTVLESFATHTIRMLKTVLLKNARTRLPFEGVAAFYRALAAGSDGTRQNPVLYVSSSPWNLYDFILDFFDAYDIPVGPVLLQDFGVEPGKFVTAGHKAHKFTAIQNILHTYPHLKFILIGDSGQQDPVIYQEVVRRFPGRILAVYIRDVQLPERAQIVLRIAEEMQSGPTPMLLVENTVRAAEHAVENGYIPVSCMDAVRKARDEDHPPPEEQTPKESPETVRRHVEEELQDEHKQREVVEPPAGEPGSAPAQ